MVDKLRMWIAGICGGTFGILNVLAVASISAAAIDDYDYVSHVVSQQFKQLVLWIGGPTAAIGCGVLFAFLTSIGFLRLSTVLGIAGGALFGYLLGPPSAILSGYGPIDAIFFILWEWFMGGVGGMVGSFVERAFTRLD